MNRRHILSALAFAAMPAAASKAANQPWSASILSGGLQNGRLMAGLEIMLQPHWKTYWRVPGQGGVPPFIQVKGENVKSFHFDCPTPTRFPSDAGEAIGYMGNVVFPIFVEAIDNGKPVEAEVSAFVGVCEQVCIPAQIAGQVSSLQRADRERLQKWEALVPKPNSNFVTSATVLMFDGKPAVRLELSQALDDIFVEGSELHYFKGPKFEGSSAVLAVAGAKHIEDLRKTPLRVTGKLPIGGLEQIVAVV